MNIKIDMRETELIKLLHQMNEIGTIVIYEIFRHVGIVEAEWNS